MSARRDHDHEAHWGRISNRPLYSEEDDVEEYIEIDTSNAAEIAKMKHLMDTNCTISFIDVKQEAQ